MAFLYFFANFPFSNQTKASLAESVVNQATNLKYVSELGFSFEYPIDMFVMPDPKLPRVYIIPNSARINDDKTIEGIEIVSMENKPPLTPLEWLKDPDFGNDTTDEYKTLKIDGQEAVSVNNGAWIVVNTPDDKYQLSIDTLPSGNTNKILVDGIAVIADSLIFAK